jgi:hypothetical protein
MMAGTAKTRSTDYISPNPTSSFPAYNTRTKLGKNNSINLLGPPDYLNYSASSSSDVSSTVWDSASIFVVNNGNQSNVSTPSFPVVSEVEFALRPSLVKLPVSNHIYFFRIRASGNGSNEDGKNGSGFSSPSGDGQASRNSNGHAAPISNSTNAWYSDAAHKVFSYQYTTVLKGSQGDSSVIKTVQSNTNPSSISAENNDYRASAMMPYLWVWSASLTPLSVSYARALSATASNGTVTLSWATAGETNSKQFTVQRSSNGTDFTQIGVVASKATNGNSSATLSYAFTDNNPVSGVNYYRLQQEDIGGNTSPSNIASATIAKGASVRLYPNPAASTVNVENLPAGSAIVVTNVAGYAVYTGTVSSSNFSINVRNLSAGVYFLQYMTNGVKNTIEFVKR